MANAYNYSNTAIQTTLGGNISAGATSMSVGATTGFPSATPYVLAVDYGAATEELVVVTAAGGTTLTVTRGFGGTSAQSHSIGAVVRHVVNAQDLTDFRTHEAATSSVHGVTGALVGATSTQTLTNKTLTSPVINGGSMSGTFSGTHAYSGAVTMSGGGSLSGTFAGSPTTSGNWTFNGTSAFAGASFSGNVTVAGEMGVSNLVRGTRATATDSMYEARATGDSAARWFTRADGRQYWGSGSATADTNLYRSAAGLLRTDTDFFVGGSLTVNDGPTWSTYTPTVTGGGAVTWGTRTGYYWMMGRLVFVNIFLEVANGGSGSSIVDVTMPYAVHRGLRQTLAIHAETIGVNGGGSATIRNGQCIFFVGGSGAVSDRLRVDDSDGDGGGNILGSDLKAGGLITIQGWYRGV
ncbi:hypothetical protein [Streptomyces rochei]|uniref:hypothetical protein n=1 Tax=Streptomyces rochei TaxID=1928 RepID=UPI0036FAF48B